MLADRLGRRSLQKQGGSAGIVIAADLIADAADGTNQGTIGAGINFAAQVVDIDIHDIGHGIAVHAPHFLNNGVARNRTAGVAQEKLQESVLLGAQFDGASGAADFMRDTVDLEILEEKDVLGRPIAAAQNGARAGNEFGDSERFDDEIVGAGIQAANPLFNRRFRRKKYDGGVRPASQDAAERVAARHAGEIHVQENKIEGSVLRETGQVVGMGNQLNGEIFLLKAGLQKFGQSGIRLGHK